MNGVRNCGDIDSADIEIQLFIEGMYLMYGYDFRDYSRPYIKRRILSIMTRSGFRNISEMQNAMLSDREFFYSILPEFSISVTEMFRDPHFFASIRNEVVPLLRTYPHLKIWHAGCSTGEEVYSMAILLQEEGLYDRCQIYATDFNENALQKARDGIYPIEAIKNYTSNYQQSGGKASFSDYYIANYDFAIIDHSVKKRIIFAEHNLATDHCFGEMNMIVCRNVLIYFNRELQNRTLKLFYDSLCIGGILCLGPKETVKYSQCADMFDTYEENSRIYRKKFSV